MSAPDLDAIRARLDAATPGPWQWRGNIDNGEPYLASRAPGIGASVLAIGTADRETTGRRADEVRSYAEESGLDPEREVEDWSTDRYGEPIKDPRLWFYTDHLAVEARDRVRFEVAPNATSRDDRSVYRADIVGINHPDAELIAHAPADLAALLAEVKRLTRWKAEATEVMAALRADVEALHLDWSPTATPAGREGPDPEPLMCECDRWDECENPHRHEFSAACVYWHALRSALTEDALADAIRASATEAHAEASR